MALTPSLSRNRERGSGTGERALHWIAQQLGPHVLLQLRDRAIDVTDRTAIMGILNVSDDSPVAFSRVSVAAARDRAVELARQGAEIIDIGAHSTRSNGRDLDPDEEAARVVPVIAALVRAGAVVSVDTRHVAVMRAALDAGARIINDVTALTGDQFSLDVAARAGASVALMHMQGNPRTMQAAPSYVDAPAEIEAYLARRVGACVAAGITPEHIAVDPGIGFGKTVEHNLDVLAQLGRLRRLGCTVLVGLSRKGFIGRLSRNEPADERLPGSLAAAAVLGVPDLILLTLSEFAEQARPFLVDRVEYDADAATKHLGTPDVAGHLQAVADAVRDVPSFEEATVEAALRATAERCGVKAGVLIHPVRVAMTGRTTSPGIFEVLVLLGRARALARLEAAHSSTANFSSCRRRNQMPSRLSAGPTTAQYASSGQPGTAPWSAVARIDSMYGVTGLP
mgnify:CR=1 FL=1